MKKRIFSALLGLALLGGVSCGVTLSNSHDFMVVKAEGDEPVEPVEEIFECSVVIPVFEHGEIKADIMEGHVGDIVTLTVKHDLFYLAQNVKVNDIALVENESTSGEFMFALAEGENKISAEFVVDQELLGTFSTMYQQASDKDWTSLFSVKNIITIVNFILSSGILIAIVRYFVKDKRLESKLEKAATETVANVVPETVRKALEQKITDLITPLFAQIAGNEEEIMRAVGVLAKCVALMQEDTPESRTAILDELSNLNIGDLSITQKIKENIDAYLKGKYAELDKIMEKLDNIIESHSEVVEDEPDDEPVEEPIPEEKPEDGRQY